VNVLALDLATACGVAIGDIKGTKLPRYSTQTFQNKQWDGAGIRYVNFCAYVTDAIKDHGIDLVVYEGVQSHTGTIAAHLYGGWLATLQIVCESNNVPYRAFGVGEIKKFWTGKGSASKQDMIKEARKRGLDPKDTYGLRSLTTFD